MHKTQVFISPEGDHYRTRLTHTLEVNQISRTIARALRLNEDLTEAIALGHDLGHTPFGHTGEDALNSIIEGGFRHNEQSVRVVKKLENNGKGLNLTEEVLDGIENHRGNGQPKTLEAKIVQLSDKIAYINHDIDDAIRAKVLNPADLPKECTSILGERSSRRIDYLIKNTIKSSFDKNDIILDEEARAALKLLRAYMFETVYSSQLQKKERSKIKHMLSEIFEYYCKHTDKLPEDYARMISEDNPPERAVCDYIAGMTDRYAMNQFVSLYMPASWQM
jgi:dGTPase